MDIKVNEIQVWLNLNYQYYPGWVNITADGITGWGTIRGLIRALQYEIGISTPNGSFGPATEAACPTLTMDINNTDAKTKRLVTILQGAMWCKGYSPGLSSGTFGENTRDGIIKLQKDAGFIGNDVNGIASPEIFKALLNMDAFVRVNGGDENIRTIQRNLNRDYHKSIGIIPCDGLYTKSTNKAIIYALQLEQSSSSADGIWGPNTFNSCPTLSVGSLKRNFVLLLQYALYANGYDPNGFDGQYGSGVKAKVSAFQAFSNLTADGIAGKQTWASLLVSYGDKTRIGKACDQWRRLTPQTIQTLKSNGYEIVGRYLTKASGANALDKNLTKEEMKLILDSGLRVFPIFQTYGGEASYFNSSQGKRDAGTAIKTACDLGFQEGTTIYFSVDYDVLGADIENAIYPHFNAIKYVFNNYNPKNYKVGVYAPRDVCTKLAAKGYTSRSFVCDMSSGFSANIGHPLPRDWAFDQISEKSIGTGDTWVNIDNNIWASNNRDMGCGSIENFDYIKYQDEIILKEAKEMLEKLGELLQLKGLPGFQIADIKLHQPVRFAIPNARVELESGTTSFIGNTYFTANLPIKNAKFDIPNVIDYALDQIGDTFGFRGVLIKEFKDFSSNIGLKIDNGAFRVGIFVNDVTNEIGMKFELYKDLTKYGFTQETYSSITIYPRFPDLLEEFMNFVNDILPALEIGGAILVVIALILAYGSGVGEVLSALIALIVAIV